MREAPEGVTYELTEFVRAKANPNDPVWALYIFGADGLHSGRQWFAKVIYWPDEQISIADAKERADEAIAEGNEVRVCDGGDMLVFHSQDGKTLHGEGFWEAIQA